jgi:hypothetical protein
MAWSPQRRTTNRFYFEGAEAPMPGGRGARSWITNESGAIRYKNGVIADPTTLAVYFPPQ